MDNQCAFGKWLYSPALTNMDRASSHYKIIQELHAEFHKIAARIAEHALAGRKDEAESMLSTSGDFSRVSARLTQAMMSWKDSLG